MQTITRSELVETLKNLKGATMVTIMAKSPISGLRKTGNPYPDALKQTFVNGVLGFDYACSVNAQLVREGKEPKFQPQPRKWGIRVNHALVEHKGAYYMTIKPERIVNTARFYSGGERIPKSAVAPFIPPPSKSQTQGTDKEIIVRDYAISGVQRVKMLGKVYRVVADPVPAVAAVHHAAPAQDAEMQPQA
jgi:hypothetical protein